MSHERIEAIWVKDKTKHLRDHLGVKYEDIAILYRTNLQVWDTSFQWLEGGGVS